MELDLPWSKNCIIPKISKIPEEAVNPGTNLPVLAREATLPTEKKIQINSAKLYVNAVILSINDNINLLEHLKQGLRRTISSNKYR